MDEWTIIDGVGYRVDGDVIKKYVDKGNGHSTLGTYGKKYFVKKFPDIAKELGIKKKSLNMI